MSSPVSSVHVPWDELLPGLRDRLVRRARRLGVVDVEAAEDLAQQALCEAWRLQDRIYDASGFDRWVYGILSNLCRRWLEGRRDDRLGLVGDGRVVGEPSEPVDGGADIEVELERRELIDLLDRALAELPPATRETLVRRFVQETPVAELAGRLGVSEGAVQMRLQRGKVALRKILTTTYQDDAAAFGLIGEGAGGWQQTPIWCPGCGSSRWEGRFIGPERRLDLRCTRCHGWNYQVDETAGVTRVHGVTGFRAVYRRTASDAYQRWADGMPGVLDHPHPISIESGRTPVGTHAVKANCPECGLLVGSSLDAQALFSPEGTEFWREHPRIRRAAYNETEVDGAAAVHTTYRSVTSQARFDTVLTRDDWRLVRADRS